MSGVESHALHVRRAVDRISYIDGFRVFRDSDSVFLQVVYWDLDVETGKRELQHGRWWHVPENATDGEIVQTALKAALTSAEHRVREHFLVDGERIFSPHNDVDDMVLRARAARGK